MLKRWVGMLCVVAACGAGATPVAAAQSDLGRAFDPQPVSEAAYDERAPKWAKRQYEFVPASDGRRLYLEWWLPVRKAGGPPVPERLPVALEITYNEAPNSDHRGEPPGYLRHRVKTALVSRGYAVARMHVRGTGASEGCFGEWGPQEADDAARVLRWLATQASWSNGRIGVYGFSGSAIAGLQAATRSAPELVAALAVVAPWATPGDYFWPDGVHGLVNAELGHAYSISLGISPGSNVGSLFIGDTPEEVAADTTRPGSIDPSRLPSRTTCQSENAVMHDPRGSYSQWVENRDAHLHIHRLRAPTMFVVGTSDMNTLTLAAAGVFDRIPRGTTKAAVVTTAGHSWPDRNFVIPEHSRPTFGERGLVAWFDRHVKRLDTPQWPTVQVQDTHGQWRTEPDWPSTGGEPAQLVLGAGGQLGTTSPSGTSSYVEGGVDDAPEDPYPGTSARWETGALPGRLHIAGMPVLDAKVSLNLPDAHLAARLEAFGADGKRLPGGVVLGWRSMQHLDPMPDGYFEQREPKLPPTDRPIPVRLRFMPADLVVPEGGRLRLTLAGSLAERPSRPSGLPTQVTILHDCTHVSALRFLLPNPKGELLNVREAHEADAPLASVPQKFGATPVDGGGVARAAVCGRRPVRLDEQALSAAKSAGKRTRGLKRGAGRLR